MGERIYEQEKQRAAHLTILLVCTVLIIVLTGESFLLGWDKGALLLLWIGLVLCWGIHVTETLSEEIRLFCFFGFSMLAFFFYGIHETSIYDLAPVMISVIILYSFTERYSIIRLCVAVYFFTMAYDFLFVTGDHLEVSSLMITRTLLHLLLVYLAGYMTKVAIRRRSRERGLNKERIAELEMNNQRTEDFLTNVSHELRTPINAVTGITAVMLKNEEDGEKRKDLHAIQTAGQRLFGQIGDILDYTEVDTGKIQVSEENYMVSSLINDLIVSNRLKKGDRKLDLIFDVDAAIPSVLLGDEKKIKKILEHLIDNAYKFTSEGGIYVRMYALPKEYGINLCIQVSDTGMGIPREELERISERFYQSNAGRNRKAGGLGLGLPIVYGMVSAMEGFIQIESTPGTGTVVSVSIPQKVMDGEPGMVLRNREKLCLACYLRPETCESPEVRSYYNETISHMVQGLEMPLHRVFHMEELKKLISVYPLTHLFLGGPEYLENAAYMENLDPEIQIVAMVDEDFPVPQKSRVKFIHKPFYTLPLVNILNEETQADALYKDKSMICPGIRVLVVDDEPMNLMVAEGIFKDYQMSVLKAESGRKAIELCERKEFDLIFLDHMMPEMDGVETLKRLRKTYADTGRVPTVIAFTANAVSGAREMFLREGFDEFISKPIERVELERILRKVLPSSSFRYVDEEERKTLNTSEEAKAAESLGDKIDRLEGEELRTASGIQYCSGDREFYVELLTKFATDQRKKAAEIHGFYQKEDWKNYQILVHALKSTAKMVGADPLSALAKQMETAAKNGDSDYIQKNHEELLERYEQLALHMKDVLELEKDTDTEAVVENTVEISREELLLRLKAMRQSLDTYEADKAEEMAVKMENYVFKGRTLRELLSDIRRDLEDFEFTSASGKLGAFIEELEGGEAE